MENEIWKSVVEYENLYMISNMGNVISLTGQNLNRKKQFYAPDKYYWYVTLINENGIKNTIAIHKLVVSTFMPNINKNSRVGYIDGNVENINLNNLKWWDNSKGKYESKISVDVNSIDTNLSIGETIWNGIDENIEVAKESTSLTIDDFFSNFNENVNDCNDETIRLFIKKIMNLLNKEILLKIFHHLWNKQNKDNQEKIINDLKINHFNEIKILSHIEIVEKKQFRTKEDFTDELIENLIIYFSKNVAPETIAIIYNTDASIIYDILKEEFSK